MSETARLAGRVVLITGAAGGIGAATAAQMARDGATLVLHDRDAASCEQLFDSLASVGRTIFTIGADLRNPTAGTEIAAEIERTVGALDVVVNNAGVELRAPLDAHSDSAWREVLDINLDAPFRICRATKPLLGRSGRGAIVNVCSTAVVGFAGQCAYDASKGGLLSLTRSLAVELATDGIRVNAVCPGFIDTPMARTGDLATIGARLTRTLPIARLGAPSEVATAIAFLASDDASYVTGQALFVDGGWIRS